MVQSIISSVYYSKLVWRGAGYLVSGLRFYLTDELYNFSLLKSAIQTNTTFFVKQGPNPVGPWYFEHDDFLSYVTQCHSDMMKVFVETPSPLSKDKKKEKLKRLAEGSTDLQSKNVSKSRDINDINNFFVTINPPLDPKLPFLWNETFTTSISVFSENMLFQSKCKNEFTEGKDDHLGILSDSHDTCEPTLDEPSTPVDSIGSAEAEKLRTLMKDVISLILPQKEKILETSQVHGQEIFDLIEKYKETIEVVGVRASGKTEDGAVGYV
jgi:hypothetical protein